MENKNSHLIKPEGPPYKGPNGHWMTEALFYEKAIERVASLRKYDPVFTLNVDKPGLINSRKTFVEIGDPTGYQWAIKYLGDWAHWLRLQECAWFTDAVAVWKAELKEKLRAEAVQKIQNIMASSDSEAQVIAAAKFLAQGEYEEGSKKRGRPSKAEVQGELKKAVREASIEDDDFNRIGLSVINGGKGG